MNNYQLNRMKMYRNVINYLDGQKGEIFSMPAFRKNIEILAGCTRAINEVNSVQENSRWGSSPEKKERKKALIGFMCRMSALLTLYAKFTGNNVLLAEVRSTPWELGRVHQVQLPIRAGTFYNRAQQHLETLGDYGITPALLGEFRKAIDTYSESIPFPRSEKAKSITATKKMTDLFRQADDALEMLDLLVETVKYSEKSLWVGYRNSRRLVREGRVKMALKVQAVNKAENKPLNRAVFTFVLVQPDRKTSKAGHLIRKKTKEQGGFYILHMPPGKYEITVTRTGYKSKKWEEYIDDRELKRMRVELEAGQ